MIIKRLFPLLLIVSISCASASEENRDVLRLRTAEAEAIGLEILKIRFTVFNSGRRSIELYENPLCACGYELVGESPKLFKSGAVETSLRIKTFGRLPPGICESVTNEALGWLTIAPGATRTFSVDIEIPDELSSSSQIVVRSKLCDFSIRSAGVATIDDGTVEITVPLVAQVN